MALSKRTQDILKASLADSVTAREVTQLLDATQASFTGQIAGMTTDVVIGADKVGVGGNITLVPDTTSSVNDLIAAHNLAFPNATVSLISGDGSQIPNNLVSVLLTASADAAGAAGNKTVIGDGIQTFSDLLGVGWTASAGGSEVLGVGVSVSLIGGADAIPAVFAQFIGQVAGMTTDVTIDADVAGLAGNVTLVADSMTDIDGLILAWNTANPGNTLTLSSGLGNQVPTADITLAGGADLVPATTASFSGMVDVIDPAIVITLSGGAGGGTLSSRAKRVLKWNFCDSRAYAEFVSVVEYGSGTLSDRTKRILSWVLCDRRAYLEIIASL